MSFLGTEMQLLSGSALVVLFFQVVILVATNKAKLVPQETLRR